MAGLTTFGALGETFGALGDTFAVGSVFIPTLTSPTYADVDAGQEPQSNSVSIDSSETLVSVP